MTADAAEKRFKVKLPEMEGGVARWYTRLRRSGSQIQAYRKQALQLTAGLPDGAAVLEVAPGPGFLSLELARLGRFHVSGLDISHTFVEIATDNARQAEVSVDFRQGDVARMPFGTDSFDLVVCQSAFKNFVQPVGALDEIHRVLRSGGAAVIQDLSSDATHAGIDQEVKRMQLRGMSALMTRATLEMLRRRAYSRVEFERLAAASAFRTCDIQMEGIGLEVRLRKRAV